MILIHEADFHPVTFPPNAYPSTISCTKGSTMDTIINAGLRKNFRKSRSISAPMRRKFIVLLPTGVASTRPRL